MKKISKFLVIAVWATLIYIFYKLNLLNGDMDNLNKFLDSFGSYKIVLFITLSTIRVAALIPSVAFMILGGIMFNPLEAFVLTLISVILSESIIYAASKALVSSSIQSYLVNKYPKLYNLLLKNSTRILAIGILCPVAPSDVACFLASSAGLSYRKFIFTVVLANMPLMLLYSFLGGSILSPNNNTIVTGGIILIITIYSMWLWNKEQKQYKSV